LFNRYILRENLGTILVVEKKFPGNTISDSFSHLKETSYGTTCEMDINGLPPLDEIKGIVFCAVIGPIFGISLDTTHAPGDFTIRNKDIGIDDRHRF
jgi:hypothetical protein